MSGRRHAFPSCHPGARDDREPFVSRICCVSRRALICACVCRSFPHAEENGSTKKVRVSTTRAPVAYADLPATAAKGRLPLRKRDRRHCLPQPSSVVARLSFFTQQRTNLFLFHGRGGRYAHSPPSAECRRFVVKESLILAATSSFRARRNHIVTATSRLSAVY